MLSNNERDDGSSIDREPHMPYSYDVVRWGTKGGGKRGGFRVIYFWDKPSSRCYMLFLYKKSEQGDLTAAQIRALARLVREEFR